MNHELITYIFKGYVGKQKVLLRYDVADYTLLGNVI